MVDRLTDQELTILERIKVSNDTNTEERVLGVLAAAEIRELRGDKMRREMSVKCLEADNARLREALKDATKGIDHYWAKCRPQVMKRIDAALKESAEPAGVYRREIPARDVMGDTLIVGPAEPETVSK